MATDVNMLQGEISKDAESRAIDVDQLLKDFLKSLLAEQTSVIGTAPKTGAKEDVRS